LPDADPELAIYIGGCLILQAMQLARLGQAAEAESAARESIRILSEPSARDHPAAPSGLSRARALLDQLVVNFSDETGG